MSRKKSPPSNIPAIDGRHNMTSLELSEADDLATLMTVDAILGFTTHKMDKNFNPGNYDKKLRDRWKEIMEEFITELNYEQTYHQLVFSDKIKPHWKKDERFKRHIFRFLYLFDKRSGIEVRPCYRYENEDKRGAAIFATREWERGSQISTLFGCISEVRPSEEEFFHETKNEFSVMYSTRKNCSQLWLGPAAYVNHDCKPNCRFTEANYDSKMTLETLRDIHPNDELLIYYGNNFFGVDNAECECFTCELRGRGLFNYHNSNSNSMQQQLLNNGIVGSLNGHYFSPSVTPRFNNDYPDNSRRVITRSAKLIGSETATGIDGGRRMTLTHSLQGALNGLKKSDNSYCLRITYSRIDRVKKKILSRGSPIATTTASATNTSSNGSGHRHCHQSSSVASVHCKPPADPPKPKLKRKSTVLQQQQQKPKHFKASKTMMEPNLTVVTEAPKRPLPMAAAAAAKLDPSPQVFSTQRRSLRQSNARNLSSRTVITATTVTNGNGNSSSISISSTSSSSAISEQPSVGKLTIKLRKTADHPNQYEHCLLSGDTVATAAPSLVQHHQSRDRDSNIFSRMTQLYLSRPPPPLRSILAGTGTPPPLPMQQQQHQPPPQSSDTPPFLSPWFCSEKSSSQSSRKSRANHRHHSHHRPHHHHHHHHSHHRHHHHHHSHHHHHNGNGNGNGNNNNNGSSSSNNNHTTRLKIKVKAKTCPSKPVAAAPPAVAPMILVAAQPAAQPVSHPLKIVNLRTKPTISDSSDGSNGLFDCFLNNAPETSSSDIPSYSASSPTIPILEIESETELVPPQLVCEILEPQEQVPLSPSPSPSPSKNKGIVMRFSRICGNRFISLLS